MIGIIVAMHKCKNCKRNSFDTINNFIRTLYKYCKHDFILYLFDNASDEEYKIPNKDIKYEYIEDQTIGGLARPYNDGVKRAIKDDCDIIVIVNDDVVFNKTINKFFDTIIKHQHSDVGLYGPLTNGINKGKNFQDADEPGRGIREITKIEGSFGVLNGFLIAFTKEFYHKFKKKSGKFFDDDQKHLWKGGERAFRRRVVPKGGRMFIIKKCWLHHHKIGGWKKLL